MPYALRLSATVAAVLALSACASSSASQSSTVDPQYSSPGFAVADDPARFDSVLAGDWRTPAFRERDKFRNPRDTLRVFGVQAQHTVIEITPGAGWYSEILAPFLSPQGQYVAAIAQAAPESAGARRNATLREKYAADPVRYGRTQVLEFNPASPNFGAANSADVVLTFRNVHNWVGNDSAAAYFRGFYDVLKPGGVLGVVDHRAKPGTSIGAQNASGYLTEERVIALATAAGFRLDARSDVNANPRDSANHPNGVWTLPPTNRHDPADAAKYQAIGESDRMALRFVKD